MKKKNYNFKVVLTERRTVEIPATKTEAAKTEEQIFGLNEFGTNVITEDVATAAELKVLIGERIKTQFSRYTAEVLETKLEENTFSKENKVFGDEDLVEKDSLLYTVTFKQIKEEPKTV